jgi:Lantibiotic dehydratase, N terminus
MAGVPFEPLLRIATTGTAQAARELLVRRSELSRAHAVLEGFVSSRASNLSADESRKLRAALRSKELPAISASDRPEFAAFAIAASAAAKAEEVMAESLKAELASARRALLQESRRILPDYLIFGAGGFGARITELLENFDAGDAALSSRNARVRERERHLVLYLQRVGAKNDTFSRFGPSAWGKIEPAVDGLRFAPREGIARREAFLERWTAHQVAAALNADPEVRAELSPRINPNGRIEGDEFVLADVGEAISLEPAMIALLRRCDGMTPAHALGVDLGFLTDLAEKNILRWAMEVPALEADAFTVLIGDISRWRDLPVRERWLNSLRPIAELPAKFSRTEDTAARSATMNEAREFLGEIGGTPVSSQRFLYTAANPIAEECFRETSFEISEEITRQFARDAEPWLDLWRDSYAFVASRVAAGLRSFFQTARVENGAVPLPAFLRHCEAQRMPLTGAGIVALAHIAFLEVKAAFQKLVNHRPDVAEWQLTAEDCHFVRRDFQYEKFDEYTFPSADLQISASSVEAVARGNFDWILSELHPPIALLHHALYWSCPDPALLSSALASTTRGRPAFHYGFFAADFTAHTVVRSLDALPNLMSFIAPQRANPKWKSVPPAEAEVYLDDETNDVCVRKRGSHEYLGSFARSWVIPLGFHPFNFGRAPHMPRLRCGRVIVQRRSWTISLEEFPSGNYTGVSRELVLAIEQCRATREWPRYVYIRPSERALRRSGAEGRDKDTKPVFIDLESYLFLEVFHRWLTKSGELEVTEMLPDPEHLLWQEADGRRTFELRTQIVPG